MIDSISKKNSSMIIWVPVWFTIVILVTTLNKTLFTAFKCPYPLSITTVAVSAVNDA